jgi:ribosomal protein S24E
MNKNKLINQKDIQTILKHAGHDIPSLENKRSYDNNKD